MLLPGDDDTRSNYERMVAGDPYISDDPRITEMHRRATRLMAALNDVGTPSPDGVLSVLRELLGSLGDGSYIRPPFHCDYGSNIRVGSGTFANFGLMALDVAPITIGDDVQVGPNVQLLTPTHPVEPEPRRAKWEGARSIVIGDNVWLGGGAIVLPGVTVGENTIIGAGAVVSRDVPPNVVAIGNPARVVRTL